MSFSLFQRLRARRGTPSNVVLNLNDPRWGRGSKTAKTTTSRHADAVVKTPRPT